MTFRRPSPPADFDRLAVHYDWIEAVCAAGCLRRARNAFLAELTPVSPIGLIGEGTGRFLERLARSDSAAEITVVDASRAMLERARRRVAPTFRSRARVDYVQADVRLWEPACEAFGGLATHFLLDCFPSGELPGLIAAFARGLRPGGLWVVSDFRIPSGVMHWPARALVALLYAGFRRATGLGAQSLADPTPMLEDAGMELRDRRLFAAGVVYSELWRKRTASV